MSGSPFSRLPDEDPASENLGQPVDDLRRSTAVGFAWTMGQALLARVLTLVAFVVLARLLTPHDYGVVALASVFTALLQVFAAGGLTQALVQRPHVDKLDLDSVFWSGVAIGALLALLLGLASWPIAEIFGEPQLGPVLRVLAISMIFVGIGSTPQAVLMRDLRFRTNAQTMIAANLVATVLAVACALVGFGVWALVVQTVTGVAVNAIATFVLSGYRPSLAFSLQRAWSFIDYSRHIVGTGFMAFLNVRADDFLIGTFISPVALGIYNIGYRINAILIDALGATSRQVAYPVFARVQQDRHRLARAYTSAVRMCALLAVPVFLFLVITAPETVPLAFGDKWEESVPVMQILCLMGPGYAVMQFNGALLQSIGRARTVFRITVLSTVFQVAAFAIAVRYGIEWVAASVVIRLYLFSPIGLFIAKREVPGTLRSHLAGVAPVFGCALAATGAALAAKAALSGHVGDLSMILVVAVVDFGTYAATLFLFGRNVLNEAAGYIRAVLSGRRVDGAPA